MATNTAAYIQRVMEITTRAIEWTKQHPTEEILLHLKIPDGMMVVGTVEDARAMGFVVSNPAGDRLLAHMCGGVPEEWEPSIEMVRLALEAMEESLGGSERR